MENKPIKIIKVSYSILDYFKIVMDLDNESLEYKDLKVKEFISELKESLNCGKARIEIKWVN